VGDGARGHALRLRGQGVFPPLGQAVLVVDEFAHVVAHGVEAGIALEKGAQEVQERLPFDLSLASDAGVVAQEVGGEAHGLVEEAGKGGLPRSRLQVLHAFVQGGQVEIGFIHGSGLLNGFRPPPILDCVFRIFSQNEAFRA